MSYLLLSLQLVLIKIYFVQQLSVRFRHFYFMSTSFHLCQEFVLIS